MYRALALLAACVGLFACTRTDNNATPGSTSSSAPGTAAAADKTSFALKGSDTMVILGQRWAEVYMKANPGATIQVVGGGSGTGIAALINGTTDVCESSRSMKEPEKTEVQSKRGAPAVETKVALDALAVYVNAKNPLKEIAVPDLEKIYLGETKNWKDVGGPNHTIVLYGRENNSGTYAYFKEHVLENKDFVANTQTLAGTSAVVAAVKGDEFGIGYGGIAYLPEGVHALSIKKDSAAAAVSPSLETAQSGTYPLARYLYFYTAGKPSGTIGKFIDWVTGPDGQKVITDVGYFPLPAGTK